MKFKVYLSALSNVESSIEVEADNEKDAKDRAQELAWQGHVVWDYNGVDDSTVECNEVQVVPEPPPAS